MDNNFDLSFGIKGFAEVKDKHGNIIQKNDNEILPWGKYKIMQSMFQTKNEGVDGIKYLELSKETMYDKTILNSYLNMNILKRFQLNRKDNVNILQYDKINYDWLDFGQFLNEYLWEESKYRQTYLLEKYKDNPTDFLSFLNIFNLTDVSQFTNKAIVEINIPLIRKKEEQPYTFNSMILTYGGNDVENDNKGQLQIDNETQEVYDPMIQNTYSENKTSWTSGIPFSIIEFTNDILVEDYVQISWKYLFNFNYS